MLRQRDTEARIPELLDLACLDLHGLEYVSAPINRYSSGPASGSVFLPSSPAMRGQSLINGTHDGPVGMDRDVDVLVVGAGPTGSTAAKYAALGGADVLLIEKRAEIGADGFESQVGRWADLQTHLRTRDIDACLQYTMVGIAGDPRLNDVYLGSCAPGGYAWVFWKAPDVANVGIGVNLSKIHDRAEAKRYLDALIARTPALAKGEIVEEVAGAVSVSLPLERTVAGGVMLAGDAARLIDPLTGGGILNGCLSGKFAGEVAAQAVEAKDASESALRAYETRWRARMEEELARHYLIKERLIRVDDDTINKVIL